MLLQQYSIPYIYITLLPKGFYIHTVNINDINVDNEFCLCFADCKYGNTTPQFLFILLDTPLLEGIHISQARSTPTIIGAAL